MANGFGGREGKGHSRDGTASLANTATTPNIARRKQSSTQAGSPLQSRLSSTKPNLSLLKSNKVNIANIVRIGRQLFVVYF